MRSLLHAVALGVLGAGILHIAVLLLVPELTERSAWSRLAATSEPYRIVQLLPETGGAPVVKSVDPLFSAVACRFDLDEGMVQVKGPAQALPFWSASVYDRNGHNVFSLNDHGATNRRLDIVVLKPSQMIEVRKNLPAEYEGAIFVETPIDSGIVVIRAFAPDESWRPAARQLLEQGSCTSRPP